MNLFHSLVALPLILHMTAGAAFSVAADREIECAAPPTAPSQVQKQRIDEFIQKIEQDTGKIDQRLEDLFNSELLMPLGDPFTKMEAIRQHMEKRLREAFPPLDAHLLREFERWFDEHVDWAGEGNRTISFPKNDNSD